MTDTRIAGIAAILFAILFVAGNLLTGDTPSGDDPDSDFVDFYEDSGNQTMLLVAAYAVSVASIALVTFATIAFRSGTWLANLARAAAYLAAVAFAIGMVAVATVGAEALINDSPIDPGVARFMPSLGYGSMLVFGALASSAMIAAISADWHRDRTMPAWLPWLGYLCAIVLLFGVIFIPMVALPIWAIVTGIVLLTRNQQPAPSRV